MVGLLLMAQILTARESTGVILPMLIFADCFAIWTYRKTVLWHHVRSLIPLALVGVICGWWLMGQLPVEWFPPLLGLVILGMIGMQIAGRKGVEAPPGRVYTIIMGWLGGVTTMLANAAGPVMTLYLLRARVPKWEFVGTAAWFFFFINLLKIPFSWELGLIHGSSLRLNFTLLPFIIVGALLGRLLIHKVPQAWFERITLWLTIPAAAHLIWQGVASLLKTG